MNQASRFFIRELCRTAEKWLRRVSKIFSAKKTSRRHHDSGHTVNVISGKAENI
jgi:hypothetical protein